MSSLAPAPSCLLAVQTPTDGQLSEPLVQYCELFLAGKEAAFLLAASCLLAYISSDVSSEIISVEAWKTSLHGTFRLATLILGSYWFSAETQEEASAHSHQVQWLASEWLSFPSVVTVSSCSQS